MKIEKLEKADLIRVQEIAKLTWPDTFKEILSSVQIEYMLSWMYNLETLSKQLDNGHLFYVLMNDGNDVGFIGVENNFSSNLETKLHKIYILPSAQGLGAGKLLMKKAEEVARENASVSLILSVNRFNKATQFYKNLGFEIVCEENIDIGNGFLMEDYVMKKTLKFS